MQQGRDIESMQVKTELRRETNWVGAFVIGLAGTILVTGVTGPVDAGLGAMAVPVFLITAMMGVLLCFFLAELAAMFPERTGGSPMYAYPGFLRWPRLASHVNGFTSWAYWLGWSPVLAVNMGLVGTYVEALFQKTWGVDLSIAPIVIKGIGATNVGVMLIGGGLSVLLFIAALLGIRTGAAVGIALAIASGLPLVFLGFAPFIFSPHLVHWSNVLPLTVVGKPFWTAAGISLVFQFFFLTTWNALAMEAAACYVGECSNPGKDAPRAIVGEALLGLVIYTMVPLAFLVVLGAKAIAIDPYAMFVSFAGKIVGGSASVVSLPLQWIVALLLIAALMLSALNAIMGSARSVYQLAVDGDFPRIFARLNRHGVPDFAMTVNTVMNLAIMLFGAPAVIYVFSNVGYLISFTPVLFAFWLLRKYHPELPRPYRLPNWMTPLAPILGVIFFIIWIVAGPLYAASQGQGPAYWLGWVVLLTYVPLYYYRKRVEDRRAVPAPPAPTEEAPTRFA
jgi:amino acid transporter